MAENRDNTFPSLTDTLSDSLLLSQEWDSYLEDPEGSRRDMLETYPSREDFIGDMLATVEDTIPQPTEEDLKGAMQDWAEEIIEVGGGVAPAIADPFAPYEIDLVKKAVSLDPKPPRHKLEQALQNKKSFITFAAEMGFPREWTEQGVSAFEERQRSKELKIEEWPDLELRDFTEDSLKLETDFLKPRPNFLQWAVGSFFEGISPIPTALLSEEQKSKMLPEPETPGEVIASLVGGIPGMGVGMSLIGAFTGGVAIPGYADKAAKAIKIVNKVRNLQRSGKALKAKNMLARAQKAGKFNYVDEKGITQSLLPGVTGLLGSSQNYSNFILKTAEKSPKLAKMIDAGARNILTFPAYGQIKADIPFSDLENRGKQAVNDVLTSFMFTAAGSPAVMEVSKMAQHTITPASLFLIGAGADIPISMIPGLDAGEISNTDRFLHGFGLMTFYYTHKGMAGARLKSKQMQLLRDIGFKEPEVRRFMKNHENINDAAIKAIVQPREEKYQNKWTDKEGREVDFLRVEERKGLVPQARYMDMETHKTETMPIRQFNRKFSRDTAGVNPKVFGIKADYNKGKRVWTVQKTDKAGKAFGKTEVIKGAEQKDEFISRFDKEIERNRKSHLIAQKAAKTSESNLGMKDKDYKVIKKALYPESEGSTINMNAAQLKEYADIIRNSKIDQAAERPGMLFLENSDQSVKGFLNSVNRAVVLPPVAYLRAAKMKNGQYSKKAKEASYILEDFRDEFASEIGTYADLDLRLKDMGFKSKEISELYGLIDPYFEPFVSAGLKKHPMTEVAVKEIKATLANTADKMAQNQVTVSRYTPTGKRTVPIWEAVDSKGNPIILKDYTGVSTRRAGEIVTDINGKRKRIKEITHNNIRDDYVHRTITAEARDLFNKDSGFREKVIAKMMRKDKNGKYIDPDAETLRLENKTDMEINEAMRSKFSDTAGWIDELGVYGRQYARIVDLPLEIAYGKNGKEILLDEFNKYKAGDTIDGTVIDKIVKLYDVDLRRSLARYGNKAAHVLAVTKTYGDKGIKSKKAQKLITDVEIDLGSDVGNYLRGVLEEQIHGPKLPTQRALKGLLTAEKYATTAVANTALSWPRSGLKNLLLGQRENLATFGFLRTARSWGHMAHTQTMANILNELSLSKLKESKYRAARHEAALVGALEEGTHLLETAKMFKLWPSLMYQSEAANRITATLAGKFAAESALDVVTGKKTPFSAMMSKKHAYHLLEETFNLRNMDQIIERGHFRQPELDKIMQRAHRTTQGSPTVEYMPTAFQNQFAKPLTLFHRMAYRVTENQYRNVIIPATKGNLWPMIRSATAAYGAGAALNSIYYMATGRPERDQFQYLPLQISNDLLAGEIFGALSNFFDDRGGYKPAMIEYAEKLSNNIVYMLQSARQGIIPDIPMEGLKELGLNDKEISDLVGLVRATYWESFLRKGVVGSAEDLAPLFNRIIRGWRQVSDPHVARAKYVHELQSIYNKDILSLSSEKNPAYGAFNPKAAFYEAIEAVFYSDAPIEEYIETPAEGEFIENIIPTEDNAEEKQRIFEAAVMLEAHRLLSPRYGNIYDATKEAIKNIKSKVASMDPVPIRKDWKSGRVIESKYDVFKSFLSDEDQIEVERARRLYEHQKYKWEEAIYEVEGKLLDMSEDLFSQKAVE